MMGTTTLEEEWEHSAAKMIKIASRLGTWDLEKKLEAELEIFSIAANVWCGETRPSEFPPHC